MVHAKSFEDNIFTALTALPRIKTIRREEDISSMATPYHSDPPLVCLLPATTLPPRKARTFLPVLYDEVRETDK
jgi:hypothetical protein